MNFMKRLTLLLITLCDSVYALNRILEASVSTAWPSIFSSPLCETLAYFDSSSVQSEAGNAEKLRRITFFLTSLAASNGALDSFAQGRERAIEAAISSSTNVTEFMDSFDMRMLQYSLSTRAHSPYCEMQRNLAQAAIDELGLSHPLNAFVVREKSMLFAESPGELLVLAQGLLKGDDISGSWCNRLDFETVIGAKNSSDEPLFILYADLESAEFADMYLSLLSLSKPFIVRCIGAVQYQYIQNHKFASANRTTLQGYGVRVDIRNLEYKSFDEDLSTKNLKGQKNNPGNQDQLLTTGDFKHSLVNGINPDILKSSNEELDTFISEYLPDVKVDKDSFSTPIVPPKTELAILPLQLTSVISKSKDPLWTLQHLSQNLPSFASSLSTIKVSSSFTSDVEEQFMQNPNLQYHGGTAKLFINGRSINIEKPSFNLFELINVIREEDSLLVNLHDELKFLDKAEKELVLNLITMGKDEFERLSHNDDENKSSKFRINVGSGYKGAVIYLNDIEKDPEYYQWPSKVEQMLMMMQFGSPPTIRRNMLTFLLVVDPFNASAKTVELMNILLQMSQSGYPLRIGVIFATENDLNICRGYMSNHKNNDGNLDCFASAVSVDNKHPNDLMARQASPESIMKVLQYIMQKYGKSIAVPYLYLLINSIHDVNLSHGDLLKHHIEITNKLGISSSDSTPDVLNALKMTSHEQSETYQNGLLFLTRKNLSPDMAFVNGIPLDDSPRDVIMNELQHLIDMILNGKITDTSPRSIYAMLLKENNVFELMHPLFLNKSPRYEVLSQDFDDSELLQLMNPENALPIVLLECIANLTEKNGLEFVKSFLQSLTDMTEANYLTEEINVTLRINPSTLNSSKSYCAAIFRQSKRFHLTELIQITDICLLSLQNPQSIEEFEKHWKGAIQLQEIFTGDICLQNPDKCIYETRFDKTGPGVLVANGRIFIPGKNLSALDVRVVLELEKDASKTLVSLFRRQFSELNLLKISRTVAYINRKFMSEGFASIERKNVVNLFPSLIASNSSLILRCNQDNDNPRVRVVSVLDPTAEATQRLSPLLRLIRDELKLPLTVIFTPRPSIEDKDKLPVSSYYRFVSEWVDERIVGRFEGLPIDQILTIRLDVPEPWNVQQSFSIQDTDNLRCDDKRCGDASYSSSTDKSLDEYDGSYVDTLTRVEYSLNELLFFGQCYDVSDRTPPNGLQITLSNAMYSSNNETTSIESRQLSQDGSIIPSRSYTSDAKPIAETLVMKTVGYWQIRSNPGVWNMEIAKNSRGREIFDMIYGNYENGVLHATPSDIVVDGYKTLVMKDFVNRMESILVMKRKGYERAKLLVPKSVNSTDVDDTIHVFSLATGHLYERLLKIMMLSVTKRTTSKVKFWLFENYLSPTFKKSVIAMAERCGFEVEFVTYKWPEWLRGQNEKQRIIWGYKILFLDVLFPLDLKKIIYIDADQVVRGDIKQLWNMDLEGAPYGYTPMCESRKETSDYRFWTSGFWKNHLQGKPYHISALYVVDLDRFRRELVGDQLRAVYQQLTADPNNLSNLDQDLPNYVQHSIKIFSLPQEWLWCESWCSEETKATAKTIDLCNNPLHKESKISMAKRIISGDLFPESWVELDAEVEQYDKDWSARNKK